jgi:hypothetical protein
MTTAKGGVVEVGPNKEKVTVRIPGGQHPRVKQARQQAQAQRCIKEIDNDDDGNNIVIPNSPAGDRNDATPQYVGQI